jgi:Zn-dependent protease
VPVEVVGPPPPRPKRRWRLPLLLFLATCASTFYVGCQPDSNYTNGWIYSVCVMSILGCHEAGHFFQARKYGVYVTFPFFLPMPVEPIGTLGAVIAMDSRVRHRKALFDIGITGPLAGLVPTLLCCIIGLQPQFSKAVPPDPKELVVGSPWLFRTMVEWSLGPIPAGSGIRLSPMAQAGWVGLLVTALNLVPIGQLDGGHILYALLRRRAHAIASLLLVAAVVATVVFQLYGWSLMLVLLVLMGPRHPPTADDNVSLGRGRIVLGWLTLAFLPVGFTPNPIVSVPQFEVQPPPVEQKQFHPPPSDNQRWVWEQGPEQSGKRRAESGTSRSMSWQDAVKSEADSPGTRAGAKRSPTDLRPPISNLRSLIPSP